MPLMTPRTFKEVFGASAITDDMRQMIEDINAVEVQPHFTRRNYFISMTLRPVEKFYTPWRPIR